MVALANNQLAGTSYDPANLVPPGSPLDAISLSDRLAALIVHTELSAASLKAVRAEASEVARTTVGSQPAPQPTGFDPNVEKRRISQVIELLLGTAEFQRK
jgi:hypothetical protein